MVLNIGRSLFCGRVAVGYEVKSGTDEWEQRGMWVLQSPLKYRRSQDDAAEAAAQMDGRQTQQQQQAAAASVPAAATATGARPVAVASCDLPLILLGSLQSVPAPSG